MEAIEAFPLTWPVGYPRTKFPKGSLFNTSFAAARDSVLHEVKLLGGKNVIISSNVPLKRDGYPYATFGRLEDHGVALYFTYEGEQVVFACDKWSRAEDNLQAIRKAVEAIRGLDRWGVSEMLKRAFTGFKALPQDKKSSSEWWEVLDIDRYATQEQIKAAYRSLAKTNHPDSGGSASAFRAIHEAYEKGMSQQG